MGKPSTFTLKIPRGETIEVHLVRLADGTLVARTAAELERAAAAQAVTGG